MFLFVFVSLYVEIYILSPPFSEMQKLEEMYNRIEIPNEDSVVTYYKIRQQLAKLAKEIEEYVHKPKYCLPFLQPGRLVKVPSDLSSLCPCDFYLAFTGLNERPFYFCLSVVLSCFKIFSCAFWV